MSVHRKSAFTQPKRSAWTLLKSLSVVPGWSYKNMLIPYSGLAARYGPRSANPGVAVSNRIRQAGMSQRERVSRRRDIGFSRFREMERASIATAASVDASHRPIKRDKTGGCRLVPSVVAQLR